VSWLDQFRASARLRPDRDLVRYFDTPLSLRRVDELSDAFAVGLAEAGVARGDRVAIFLQNVPQYPIALLAAWKLGAIAVACNPMLRGAELAKQLDDAGAETLIALESLYAGVAEPIRDELPLRVVVTTSELDLLDQARPAILSDSRRDRRPGTLDLLELAARHAGRRPPPIELASDEIAILTYTSGTTGPAKGAMSTHGNLAHAVAVWREGARLDEQDVVLGIAPLFHVTGLIAHMGIAMCVWLYSAAEGSGPGRIRACARRTMSGPKSRPVRSSHGPFGRPGRYEPVESDELRVRGEYGFGSLRRPQVPTFRRDR
jgi:long-chain acyl-CoA synthetase